MSMSGELRFNESIKCGGEHTMNVLFTSSNETQFTSVELDPYGGHAAFLVSVDKTAPIRVSASGTTVAITIKVPKNSPNGLYRTDVRFVMAAVGSTQQVFQIPVSVNITDGVEPTATPTPPPTVVETPQVVETTQQPTVEETKAPASKPQPKVTYSGPEAGIVIGMIGVALIAGRKMRKI